MVGGSDSWLGGRTIGWGVGQLVGGSDNWLGVEQLVGGSDNWLGGRKRNLFKLKWRVWVREMFLQMFQHPQPFPQCPILLRSCISYHFVQFATTLTVLGVTDGQTCPSYHASVSLNLRQQSTICAQMNYKHFQNTRLFEFPQRCS